MGFNSAFKRLISAQDKMSGQIYNPVALSLG